MNLEITERERKSWCNYQSTPGVAKRLRIYGLEKYLRKNMNLLDIGCNAGEFVLALRNHVEVAFGFDPVVPLPKSRGNVRFESWDFLQFLDRNAGKKYEAILMLAVTNQICQTHKLTVDECAEQVIKLLDNGGVLLIESHKLSKSPENLAHNKALHKILGKRLKLVKEKPGRTNGPRRFYVYRKI